ncbi:MAG: tellurite resistance TerB family protein, partial [Novosphingobium sp.]|nr:tellurite resistance TerB family protein [Novosphingobium sp.]
APVVLSEPGREEELSAALMLRAVIQAVKCDGDLDDAERERLTQAMGEASQREVRAVEAELQRPVDVKGLARAVPAGLEPQVYMASLMAIDLDSRAEADYLHELASALGALDGSGASALSNQPSAVSARPPASAAFPAIVCNAAAAACLSAGTCPALSTKAASAPAESPCCKSSWPRHCAAAPCAVSGVAALAASASHARAAATPAARSFSPTLRHSVYRVGRGAVSTGAAGMPVCVACGVSPGFGGGTSVTRLRRGIGSGEGSYCRGLGPIWCQTSRARGVCVATRAESRNSIRDPSGPAQRIQRGEEHGDIRRAGQAVVRILDQLHLHIG